MCDVSIGELLNDLSVPKYFFNATPEFLSWKSYSLSFIASQPSQYIAVKIGPGYNSWNQVDNFIISRSPIPLDLAEHKTTQAFKISPNPASQNINVSFDRNREKFSIEVFNAFGQSVIQKTFFNSSDAMLDTSSMPEGLYSVIVSDSRTSVTKKALIVR